MVNTFLNRVGNLGLLLIACALLLGGLAGAAVAHHYDRLSADTVATQQHPKVNATPKPKHQPAKPKHSNHGRQDGKQGNNSAGTD